MRHKKYIVFLLLGILAGVFFLLPPAGAEETLKDTIARKYAQTKDICPVVKQTINDGINTKEICKSSIELGHDACVVIRCAIAAEGDLLQIITGAIEAGATPDVCSRCAIEAGADPKDVAKALETGLGYSPPMAAGLSPVEIGLPGGNTSGGIISVSSFE
ncbi:MAG: hypothetical protein AB1442_12600 [Nitrospirota bacterium]